MTSMELETVEEAPMSPASPTVTTTTTTATPAAGQQNQSLEGRDRCQCPEGGDIVIIPIDSTAHTEEAFTWYIEHLHKPKNSVILVHAQDPPTMPTRDPWESQISGSVAKRQELVDKYNARFKELGMQGRCVVDIEKAGPLVIDVAKQEGADYIVMGTRGQGVLKRTLMGSVSDYVVHNAQCPVIVCRH